ncbi:MAG: DUF3782 domain-containing protein [Chloroflexota bacterium]|nr:DUF3782 domain-containing protein [Chloroflexota bacterium]
MTLEQIEEFILERLPGVLERDPRFVTFTEGIVAEKFPRRDELARLLNEVQQHRQETTAQFVQVEQRFDRLEQRMEDGFRNVQISIDRLGQRWGIRNESLFRQTMREVLEKSFAAQVEERSIGGEQFDWFIMAGGQHILVEISASVGQDMLKKLQRKRQIYRDETGVTPARFLLAVGSIHSRRANALREAGFEVIEPETDEE